MNQIAKLIGQLAQDVVQPTFLERVYIKSVDNTLNTCVCVPSAEWTGDSTKEYDIQFYNVEYSTGGKPRVGSEAYIGYTQAFQPVLLFSAEVSAATFTGDKVDKQSAESPEVQAETTKRLLSKRGARISDGIAQTEISSDGIWGINMPYYSFTTLNQQGQIELMRNKINLSVDMNGGIYIGKSKVEVVKVYDDDITKVNVLTDGEAELDPKYVEALKTHQAFVQFLCENIKLGEAEYNAKKEEFKANHNGFWIEPFNIYNPEDKSERWTALENNIVTRRVRHLVNTIEKIGRTYPRKIVYDYDLVNQSQLVEQLRVGSVSQLEAGDASTFTLLPEVYKIIDFIKSNDTYRTFAAKLGRILRAAMNPLEFKILGKAQVKSEYAIGKDVARQFESVSSYLKSNVEKTGTSTKPIHQFAYTQSESLLDMNTILNGILDNQKSLASSVKDLISNFTSGNAIVIVNGAPVPVTEVVPKFATITQSLNDTLAAINEGVKDVNALFLKEPFNLFKEL